MAWLFVLTEAASHRLRIAAILVALPILLAADHGAGLGRQALLGALTTGLLMVLLRGLPQLEQGVVWACVVISTAVELIATQLWGVYAYRLGNVPLFVPPGHGLLCLLGISVGAWVNGRTARRQVVGVGLAVATVWAACGLWVFPRSGAPTDVLGALFLPWFAYLLLRTERAVEYAATFAGASLVEVVGVLFANWHWSPVLPGFGIGCGNPPSVAGGGYAWFGFLGYLLVSRWRRAELRSPAVQRT